MPRWVARDAAEPIDAMIVTESIVRATVSPEYRAIQEHFAARVAHHSGVPLLQHIEEGLVILGELDATEDAMRAFCLHPLFDSDEALIRFGQDYMNSVDADPFIVLLVMEYRYRINAWRGTKHSCGGGSQMGQSHDSLPVPGPLEAVQQMLIATQVHGRKELVRQPLRGRDSPSVDRMLQFDQWLLALGVDSAEYEELCAAVDLFRARR